MRRAFRIFKRDVGRLVHNRVAMIVMAGVCVLPSLYAWFNIGANMDPYSNTQGIKVAVANNDREAANELLKLNAGESIEDNLRENEQLGWTFVEEAQAVEGVKSGEYYAAIVIPEDFSSSLLSIISGSPKKPRLDYYINEKKNAIAPKITDTGAGTVQQEINDTFSSVAAETISKIIQDSVTRISGDMGGMNTDVMRMLSEIGENLGQYQSVLKNFQDTVGDSSGQISSTQNVLDSAKAAAESGARTLSDTSSVLSSGRGSIGEFSSVFSGSLSNGENWLNDIYGTASDSLNSLKNQADTVNGAVKDGIDSVQNLMDTNRTILEKLQEISDGLPDALSEVISEQIAGLQAQNAEYQNLLDSLSQSNASTRDAMDTAQSTKEQLESLVSQSRQSLRDYRTTFDQTLLPQMNQSLDTFSALGGEMSSTLAGVSSSTDQLKAILSQLGKSLEDSSKALGKTGESVASLNGQMEGVMTDLQALQSSEAYQKFLSLEGLDADSIADFMASPVNIQSETLYSVKNYGSSMTPFYTNLALWVGGIVLIAILKMEVDRGGGVSHFTTSEAYFGRWFLFVILGLIQGLIVCLGDLWLLKVQCIHPVAFVLTGMFCSFVYVNLIYALSSALKHIGKALCIVLVILQIPGSAGTYPIEMTPAFFQKLHPLLPFTYGINAMREAIAGMYGNAFWNNLVHLALYFPAALLIGLGLGRLMVNLNDLFDRKLGETDLMLCETPQKMNEKTSFSLVIKTLLRDQTMREDLVAKAAAFESGYRKRIRIGFLAIIILPAVFLILMFSIESKIVFLVLWIVSIIVIAVYLICQEYIHDRLKRQIELGSLTREELLDAVNGRDES